MKKKTTTKEEVKPKLEGKKLHKGKNFMKGWKNKLRERFKPSRTMLIEMSHANGTISHFTLSTNIHKFQWNNMAYIVDEDRKLYANTSKVYMLRYHEGFALPYEIEITASKFKKALPLDNPDIKEISTSYNPFVLKDILKFEYAKGVIQGAEVHEFIKKSFLLLIIIGAIQIAHLALAAYKGGWI